MQLSNWPVRIISAIVLVVSLAGAAPRARGQQQLQDASSASEKAALEAAVQERNTKLSEINKQLEEARKNLDSTQGQRISLQREVKTLDGSIQTLNLNIQSDELQMATLGDEIASLSSDIDHINASVAEKQQSVGDTLRALQRQNDTTILASLLRGSTLADSVFNANSLSQLQNKLRSDIAELSDMEKQMAERVAVKQGYKQDIAVKKESLASRKSIVEDQKTERATLLEVTRNKESTYQKQLADLQKQQDKIEAEINTYEQQLKDKFDTKKLAGLGKGIFSWPIVLLQNGGVGRITQHFGEISNLYRGKGHNGLDVGVPVGTPVYAAADGTVMAADNNDQSGWRKYQYGKHILIRHADNLATLYGHLSRYIVSPGQAVVKGQLIGYSGNTGYSTGAHLHFGVYWAPSIELKYIPPAAGRVPVGVVLNPEDYL